MRWLSAALLCRDFSRAGSRFYSEARAMIYYVTIIAKAPSGSYAHIELPLINK